MTVAVLHALWLHGRDSRGKTCRSVLTEPFCVGLTPMSCANTSERGYYEQFLATPEADEAVGVVLDRYTK